MRESRANCRVTNTDMALWTANYQYHGIIYNENQFWHGIKARLQINTMILHHMLHQSITKYRFIYCMITSIQWWFRYWFEMNTICSIIIHSRSGDIKPFYKMHVQKKKKGNHGNYNKIGKKYELRAWALEIVLWYLLSVSGSHSDFIFIHTISYIWNTELLRGTTYFGISKL